MSGSVTAGKQMVSSVVTLNTGRQGQTSRAVYQNKTHRWLQPSVGDLLLEERIATVGCCFYAINKLAGL